MSPRICVLQVFQTLKPGTRSVHIPHVSLRAICAGMQKRRAAVCTDCSLYASMPGEALKSAKTLPEGNIENVSDLK